MALVAYVPLLLTKPGWVAADTKQYLYLDPGRLTAGAASMWDPNVGMGTVTHQNIGYLWPMGPYYTVIGWLGVPMWLGQRLWMGTLLLAAGAGAAWCGRRLGLSRSGAAVAGFAYLLSPYVIDYIARTSAILMPWAALGWLIGLTVVAARTGRWRPVAAFALVVATVGGVNATSILLVGLAPAAWLAFAAAGTGEISVRRALGTAARLVGVSLLVSLWWIAGLWAEGRYGLNILRVTETVPTVAHTSSAAEVLRGLGYWYFYGWDKVQPWTEAAVPYTQSLWLLAVGFAVPALSVALGWGGRWRYRPFAVALLVGGTLIAVGAYPYQHPSLIGRLIESSAAGSTLALAARSVDRAVPLVVLGLALLMGSGVSWLRSLRPGAGAVVGLACLGLVAADLPPLWTGQLVAGNLARPAGVPGYWHAAASYLDASGNSTRVLGLPGEDFAAYSWGVTEDPVATGLMTRPWTSRQVVPAGTPASANLLQAVDEPLQEGALDPAAIAPMARLMSAGDVVLQSDLQAERYELPLPQVLWQRFTPTPAGLSSPVAFGAPNPAAPIRYPLNNEARLALPPGAPQPPALAVFGVPGARPIARTEAPQAPVVVAGDGRGLVEAASAGLLDTTSPVLYAATLARDPSALARTMAGDAPLVLTDTNLRAGQRWGTLSDNIGAVQTLAPPIVDDPSDYQLPVFPGQTSADQTVAQLFGARAVRATAYGNAATYTPEDRPANAVDGNPSTAWTFGAHSPVGGVRLRVDLDHPVRIDHVTLLQATGTRHVTGVTVEVDGHAVAHARLGPASLSGQGQVVRFPAVTGNRVDLVVDGATGGAHRRFDGLGSVGFREVAIPGVGHVGSTVRLPTDLLQEAGASSLKHPLTILLSRMRAPQPPRSDPEQRLVRTFTLPTARSFAVGGTAEVATTDSDQLISQLVGQTGSAPSAPAPGGVQVVSASSSGRLVGDRSATAMAAVDGNPATAWSPDIGSQVWSWLRYQLSAPLTVDHLNLQVVNDGRHSLPTTITVAAGGQSRTVQLPPLAVGTGRPQGSTTSVPLHFAPVTGSSVTVTIDGVHQVRQPDYYSTFTGQTDELPIGIAELGLPVSVPPVPAQVPVTCRSDLVAVDSVPIPVQVTGSTGTALGGGPLTVKGCGSAADGVHLSAGSHTITTSRPGPSGWAVDTLNLGSAAGGAPAAPAAPAAGAGPGPQPQAAAAPTPASPPLAVLHQDRTSMTVRVGASSGPFWLVLGQSLSSGWKATLPDGRSLGPPTLVDGYANGWYVPAGVVTQPTVVTLRWTPQQVVWAAIAVSAAAFGVSALVVVLPPGAFAWVERYRWRAGRARRAARTPGRPLLARRGAAPAATVVAAAAVGAVSDPVLAAVVLAAAAVGSWRRWARLTVRGAAVAAYLSVGVYVVAEQARWRYWPTIDWPLSFPTANGLAWTALGLTAADVCAGALAARRQRDRRGA